MRKLFLAFVAFLAFCLVGCMTTPLSYQENIKMGGQVKIVDSWSTADIHGRASGFGSGPVMRGITIVVGNPTDKQVEAEVSCRFEDETLFGKTGLDVPAHSKRKVMVRGFNQCQPGVCDSELVLCSLRLR